MKNSSAVKPLKILFFIFYGILFLEVLLQLFDYSERYLRTAAMPREHPSGVKIILCVGDSTTAVGMGWSYPSILQKRLNKLYGDGKFKVINAGVPGITTAGILASLSDQIDNFKPDYIITMAGVNDVLFYNSKVPFLNRIKTYSFLKRFFQSYLSKSSEFDFDTVKDLYSYDLVKDLKSSNEESEAEQEFRRQDFVAAEKKYLSLPTDHVPSETMLWNLAIINSNAGNRESAYNYFLKLLKIRDDAKVNYSIAWYLITHYPSPAPETQYAYNFMKRALQLEPDNVRLLHFMGQILKNELKQLDAAEPYYLKANSTANCNLGVVLGLSDLYQKKNRISEAVKTLKQCADSDEVGAFDLWRRLVILYIKEQKFHEAHLAIAEGKKRFPGYVILSLLENEIPDTKEKNNVYWDFLKNDFTVKNYRSIANLIREKNIKHIAMQYPVREIDSLEAILKDFENITYIKNDDNFKILLSKHSYQEVFLDKVNKDFGHSTQLGNEAIVERIIETLISEKILPAVI